MCKDIVAILEHAGGVHSGRAGRQRGEDGSKAREAVAYAAACPTRQALDRIADKSTVLVIGLLEQRPHRFGELLKAIEGISQKMLTQTLRSLEHDGLVDRRAKATVPVTVEYSLTATGRTLAEPVDAIRRWAEQHIEEVLAARSRQPGDARSREKS